REVVLVLDQDNGGALRIERHGGPPCWATKPTLTPPQCHLCATVRGPARAALPEGDLHRVGARLEPLREAQPLLRLPGGEAHAEARVDPLAAGELEREPPGLAGVGG